MKKEIQIRRLSYAKVYWQFWSICKAMLLYCLKCRKNAESKNPKVARTKTKE